MCSQSQCNSRSTPIETNSVSEAPWILSLPKSAVGGQKKKSSSRNLKACPYCNYPVTAWGPLPVPINKEVSNTRKLRHQFTPAFLCSVWPKYRKPPTTLVGMNEEETAIWIEMLAIFKGWKEAKTYSRSFKSNCVTGYLLPYLSVEVLKSELDIFSFGHRLEIIEAIENNELTLVNPFVVSFQSDAYFFSVSSAININNRNSQWMKKLETTNVQTREVSKWHANMPRKPSISYNSSESGSINSWHTSYEDDWSFDPDLRSRSIFEGTSILTPMNDSFTYMVWSDSDSEQSNMVKPTEL